MSARFAETCRGTHLKLMDYEDTVRLRNTVPPVGHTCQRDAYLGVFFDGTNNNKYRDLPTNSASNVARLFEAFIGSPAEAAPTYGGKPNQPLKSDEVKAADFPFYRKIYVPGVGTACPEVSDPGENENRHLPNPVAGDKTRGLAFAALGEARIQWALLEVLNQVHYMFTGAPFAFVSGRNRLAIVQLREQISELASFGLIKTMGFPAFLAEASGARSLFSALLLAPAEPSLAATFTVWCVAAI